MSSDKSSESLESLKSLVHQLQAKIERLESQAKQTASDATAKAGEALSSVKDTLAGKAAEGGAVGSAAQKALTPAQHIRMVLMGPPGAGTALSLSLLCAVDQTICDYAGRQEQLARPHRRAAPASQPKLGANLFGVRGD